MASVVKSPPANAGDIGDSLGREGPWRREWLPTPVFLPGKFHGQRAWRATVHGVAKEPDTTEQQSPQNSNLVMNN